MTVVVYKDGVLASDSLSSASNSICSYASQKIWRLPSGALIGFAGDCDRRDALALFAQVKSVDTLPTRAQLAALKQDMTAIVVLPDGEVWMVSADHSTAKGWEGCAWKPQAGACGIGSGSEYALGAMEFGANAVAAVKIGIKWDKHCGGRVQTLKLRQDR